MATFLDISILGHFTSIFTFLLVFVIVYGMLELFKVFGDQHKGLHAIIALAIGFIVIVSSGVTKVIQTFTPWITILIIVFFFIMFVARMFGASEKDIANDFYHNGSVVLWTIIFIILIILFSLSAGFGQQSLEETTNTTKSSTMVNGTATATGTTNTGNFNQNLYNTLFHPKVLGLILVFGIAIIALLFLTTKNIPS